MAELNIHQITSNDVSAVRFIEEAIASEWNIGMHDIDCFLASDDPGIYIAELNGTPIGAVSFTKYSSTYYSFGFYIVEEKNRGKGYGTQMFKTAIEDIDSSQNISTYSYPEMVKKYEIHGFRRQWLCSEYEINLSKALEILKAIPSTQNGITAKSINDADQEALLDYDTGAFGYQRHSFLIKWLHTEGRHIKVAINSEGAIIGYAVARMLYRQHKGYILGPLFADSYEAAKVLLRELFDEMICKGLSSSQSVCMYCPNERNSSSVELMKELQSQHNGKEKDLIYMTTKDVPRGCFDKWFGITSTDIA